MPSSKTKLLALLVVFVLFVNYRNYLQPDRAKLHRQIELLQKKIERDKRLAETKVSPSSLQVRQLDLFFPPSLSYSQSMGKLQEMVTSAAKNRCDIKRLKWSQLPASSEQYDRMKMNLSMQCAPRELFDFANSLRAEGKLMLMENTRIYSLKRNNKLEMDTHVVAYRIKHAF